MVPDSTRDPVAPEGEPGPETGDDTPAGFDEAALYRVVHEAVKDALLDVVGTLLLVGTAFVLVLVGGRAVVSSGSAVEAGFGLLVVVFGVYLAAASLEVVPPVTEWVR